MAQAARITVMSSNAFREAYLELVPQFEKASGHRVTTSFVGGVDIMKRMRAGETVDLVILQASAVDELAQLGKIVPGSRVDLARSGIGVAVCAGAPRPDIGSAEALKRALLAGGPVAISSGPSGVYLAGLLKGWGIPDNKIRQTAPGAPAGEAVLRGEADTAFQQVSELLAVKGIDYVGPLPADVQKFTVFSAGLHAGAKSPEAARQLTGFLTSPAAAPVIRGKGMEAAQPAPRFHPLAREEMSAAQKTAYDAIAGGPRGGVRGPFNALLRSPELADRAQKMGEYIRFDSSLPPRLSEFAILITARHWSSQYEWFAHAPLAVKGGLAASVIADLREGKRPGGMNEDEAAVYDFCHELHATKGASDAAYQRAFARFGERGVVDLIGVSGYYTLVSMVLNVDRHPLPAGAAAPLPPLVP